MPKIKINLNHEEARAAIAFHTERTTGFKTSPEEVAFFHEDADNPHGAQEIEVSVSITATPTERTPNARTRL